MVREIKYVKRIPYSNVQTFLFERCVFVSEGTCLNLDLQNEYLDWKRTMNIIKDDKESSEIKEYLRDCPHVLYETVWATSGNGQGYYGLRLKSDIKQSRKSSTGCRIQKVDSDNNVLSVYETIAKSAQQEGISAAKMSRYIKHKTIIGDYHYRKENTTRNLS